MKPHRYSVNVRLGHFIKYLLIILCMALIISSCATQTDCSNPQDRSCARVLFIGNSYTFVNDLPIKFAKLAKAGKHEVQVGVSAEGGWTLADHVKSTNTRKLLNTQPWTYVVLQEQSQIPSVQQSRTQSMYPSARTLVKQVRGIGAKPVLFLTWAHREGFPENGMNDYESMQSQVNNGYYGIAKDLNVTVVPVGSAWRVVVKEHPEINLWRDDGSHPSKEGTYLAACVFYSVIFQESPVGLTYYAGLSKDVATTLQTVASQIVLNVP